ncbi:MAG: isoprenylcysteine carboxylmethyltransferase family protein [Pirellulales bacterium]
MAANAAHAMPPTVSHRRLYVRFAVGLAIAYAVLLFLPAGTIDWPLGWLFAGMFTLSVVLTATWVIRVNPEIIEARSRIHQGTKRWDLFLLPLLLASMFAIYPVAALDNARFHWSHVERWTVVLGYILLVPSLPLGAWAESVNKFFEPSVRIQADRGQHVIDRGPYAFVRHPGYVSALLMLPGSALALGSSWALVPAAICSALIVLRTVWEDRMLHEELPGYREYAARVRYRLLPGVW